MTHAELQQMVAETAGAEVAKALKGIHERIAANGRPVGEREDMEARGADIVLARTLAHEKRALNIGGVILCLAEARGDYDRACEIAKKEHWKGMPSVEKTLVSGEATQGGVLVSPEHSQELIDLLAPRTVVRRRITDVVDVSAGMIDMPRLTADAQSSWGGEIEEIREGAPTFDQIVMRAFQHKVLVPVSNTLLRRGGPRVAATVRNSTLRAMALGEDRVFLTSPGSEHRPKGIKYWVQSGNRKHAQAFTGTDADKLLHATEDLGSMILALEEANVPMTAPAFTLAPRTKMYLMTARDGNGNFAFREEMLRGTVWGIPYDSTTHIARNEGTGTDESTIYLVDYDELALGQGQGLEIALSSEATFVDADGNVVSAFQRNLTLLRMIQEVDLKPKHVEALVSLDQVKWAPNT